MTSDVSLEVRKVTLRCEGIVSRRTEELTLPLQSLARLAQDEGLDGAGGAKGGRGGLGMSYLSITDTVTLTSDAPAILTTAPETWTMNSS